MSYRKLNIWELARDLTVRVHSMTIKDLPKFEMYEQGSQIRRSAKSIRSNIVEGYGRRRYKQEFIRFLIFAQASCDETADHLEILFETESLKNQKIFNELHELTLTLGKKINRFIQTVEKQHNAVHEQTAPYECSSKIKYPASKNQNLGSSILNPESRIQHLGSSI